MIVGTHFIMRIDKFLKISRIIKRRTVASDAASNGRITVNGKQVKPAYDLKIGDIIEVSFGERVFKCKVLSMPEHCPKDDSSSMYQII